MKNIFTEISNDIAQSTQYKQALHELFSAYIDTTLSKEPGVSEHTLSKLSSTAQIFYNSESPKHNKHGAALLSMLLDVSRKNSEQIVPIAKNIYAASGDFPNIDLLTQKYNDIIFLGDLLMRIIHDARRTINTIDNVNFTLTDYQRCIWDIMNNGDDIITSAPTSTGKTHLILEYISAEIAKRDAAFAAILVPTRALISEMSQKIYGILKSKGAETDVEICTVPKPSEQYKQKTIFVMTQERLFEVLQRGDVSFDYLFIDEAHNISDSSRGALLHLTIEKLLELRTPQVIASTPSKKYINAFGSILGDIQPKKESTAHAPVTQIHIDVKFIRKKIILSLPEDNISVAIDKPFNGTRIEDIVYLFGKNESNIIYRNSAHDCEKFAQNMAKRLTEKTEHEELALAADYIENFLHHDFSLAKVIKKGVAFHYGPLPAIIRTMVEDLARNGAIKYIACTSTLAEGVNLPAKNIFLKNPLQKHYMKAPTQIEEVKINNITGRAGRMLHHFAGNIFIIEQENWKFKDYFTRDDTAPDKIPTFYKTINDKHEMIIEALRGNANNNDDDDRYSYYTIANKLIKNYQGETLEHTLSANELTISHKTKKILIFETKKAHDSLLIDTYTLEANPTIGFIQQNNLFKEISETKNISNLKLLHPRNKKTYDKILNACTMLNNVDIFIPQRETSIPFACTIASKWIQEYPIKEIINEQLDYDKKNKPGNTCDKSIRTVISVINNDVQFRMSTALKCYHTLLTRELASRNEDLNSSQIHTYIEVGGYQDRVINLINIGVSRESAIQINNTLPADQEIKTHRQLAHLFRTGKLTFLHKISQREIANIVS